LTSSFFLPVRRRTHRGGQFDSLTSSTGSAEAHLTSFFFYQSVFLTSPFFDQSDGARTVAAIDEVEEDLEAVT
jgi:hypothetical protein